MVSYMGGGGGMIKSVGLAPLKTVEAAEATEAGRAGKAGSSVRG